MEHRAILATYNQVYNNSSIEIINESVAIKYNTGLEKMFTSDRTSFSLGSKTFFTDNDSVQTILTPQNIKKYLPRQQQIKLDILRKDNYNVTSLLVYNQYTNSFIKHINNKYSFNTPPWIGSEQVIFLGTDGEGKNFAIHQNKLYREDGSLVKRDPAKKVNTESMPVEIFLTFTKGKHKVNPDGSLTLGDLYIGNTRGKRLMSGEMVKLNKIPNGIKIQQVNTLELGEFTDFKNIANLPSITKKLRIFPSYKNIILPHMPGLKNMSIIEEVNIVGNGNTKDYFDRCEFSQFKDLNINRECLLSLKHLKILNFKGIKSLKNIIIESCLIKSFNGLSSCDGANIILSIFRDPKKRPPSLEGLPSTVDNFILDFETNLFKYPERPVNSDFLNGFPNLVEKDFFITKSVFESLSNNFKEIGLSDRVQGDIVILDEIYFWHGGGIETWAGSEKARINSDNNGRVRTLNRLERLKYSKIFTDTLNKGKTEDDWQF